MKTTEWMTAMRKVHAQSAVVHRRCAKWVKSTHSGHLRLISWTYGFAQTIIYPCRFDTTMDIGGWLRGLGLGQYETTFRENEIDAEVLPELTESDLSQLGVPLGHRKRLLKAIAALGAAEKAAAAPGLGDAQK